MCLYIFILLSFGLQAQTQVAQKTQNIQFARYLHLNGYFGYAARSYEPLLSAPFSDTLTLFWMQCCQKAGLWQNVSAFGQANQIRYSPEIGQIYVRLMIQNNAYNELLSPRGMIAYSNLIPAQQTKIRFAAQLLSMDLDNARRTIMQNPDSTRQHTQYIQWLDQAKKLPHRSAALAIVLSSIVPGSGKIYVGEWKDGLISLATVGIYGWQTYRGFKDKGTRSVLGWISASMGASFYIGNIWGSGQAARRFNKRKKDAFINEKKAVILADLP